MTNFELILVPGSGANDAGLSVLDFARPVGSVVALIFQTGQQNQIQREIGYKSYFLQD